jgi:hypothetical protein
VPARKYKSRFRNKSTHCLKFSKVMCSGERQSTKKSMQHDLHGRDPEIQNAGDRLQTASLQHGASRQREILAKGPRLPVTTDSSQGAAAWYSSSRREGGVVAGLTAAILQRRRTTVAVLERCRCLYLVRRQSYVSPNIVEFFWKMTWRGGGVVCRRYQQSRTRLIVEFSSSAVTCRPRDAGAGRRR